MAQEDKYEMDEQEYDSQELSSIIKTEMDDARDFIDQIGQERDRKHRLLFRGRACKW